MARDDVLRREIVEIYRRRARRYDLTANLYYLIGYPEWRYRRLTIESLALARGDTVVEIGCGTGLNFSLVQERIGPEGKLIGVDLTDAMLEQARIRVHERGWDNVELVHRDAADYDFPVGIQAMYSTFAISLIPEAPEIIEKAAESLSPAGRVSIMDLKIPESWPDLMMDLVMWIVKPFTPTEEWRERRPWPGIQAAVRGSLRDVWEQEFYLGTSYLISGGSKS